MTNNKNDESSVENELNAIMSWRKGISFMPGTPDLEFLKPCSEMLFEASNVLLNDPNLNVANLFKYGENQGDKEFREELSKFLSIEYGDAVKSSNLMVTAGATQGLHAILSILCETTGPVFVEDPTYFLASRMFKNDLKILTVPVQSDQDGMIPECLEQAVAEHKNLIKYPRDERSKRFWAVVYIIPVYGNPTGWTYSEERCKKLLQVARRYNILIIAEDVYNLIHLDDGPTPKRLLSYDLETDPDFAGGHVLSNCTFSKIFAPSVRLGWIEGPNKMLMEVINSYLTWSGGSFNHYMAKLMTKVMLSGRLAEHVKKLREGYKSRLETLCKTLDELKPDGWIYQKPKGGFFVWVTFSEKIEALEFMKFAREKYDVSFLPGICCSPTLTSKHSARLSFSCLQEDAIIQGIQNLILAYQNFISLC